MQQYIRGLNFHGFVVFRSIQNMLMDFKILRAMSVCTSAISVSTRYSDAFWKTRWFIPSAVVILTTADRMHRRFPEYIRNFFFIFRSLPTSHGDCRSPLDHCNQVHILLVVVFSYIVLVLIKLTKFAVALRLRCGSFILIFDIISSSFAKFKNVVHS